MNNDPRTELCFFTGSKLGVISARPDSIPAFFTNIPLTGEHGAAAAHFLRNGCPCVQIFCQSEYAGENNNWRRQVREVMNALARDNESFQVPDVDACFVKDNKITNKDGMVCTITRAISG